MDKERICKGWCRQVCKGRLRVIADRHPLDAPRGVATIVRGGPGADKDKVVDTNARVGNLAEFNNDRDAAVVRCRLDRDRWDCASALEREIQRSGFDPNGCRNIIDRDQLRLGACLAAKVRGLPSAQDGEPVRAVADIRRCRINDRHRTLAVVGSGQNGRCWDKLCASDRFINRRGREDWCRQIIDNDRLAGRGRHAASIGRHPAADDRIAVRACAGDGVFCKIDIDNRAIVRSGRVNNGRHKVCTSHCCIGRNARKDRCGNIIDRDGLRVAVHVAASVGRFPSADEREAVGAVARNNDLVRFHNNDRAVVRGRDGRSSRHLAGAGQVEDVGWFGRKDWCHIVIDRNDLGELRRVVAIVRGSPGTGDDRAVWAILCARVFRFRKGNNDDTALTARVVRCCYSSRGWHRSNALFGDRSRREAGWVKNGRDIVIDRNDLAHRGGIVASIFSNPSPRDAELVRAGRSTNAIKIGQSFFIIDGHASAAADIVRGSNDRDGRYLGSANAIDRRRRASKGRRRSVVHPSEDLRAGVRVASCIERRIGTGRRFQAVAWAGRQHIVEVREKELRDRKAIVGKRTAREGRYRERSWGRVLAGKRRNGSRADDGRLVVVGDDDIEDAGDRLRYATGIGVRIGIGDFGRTDRERAHAGSWHKGCNRRADGLARAGNIDCRANGCLDCRAAAVDQIGRDWHCEGCVASSGGSRSCHQVCWAEVEARRLCIGQGDRHGANDTYVRGRSGTVRNADRDGICTDIGAGQCDTRSKRTTIEADFFDANAAVVITACIEIGEADGFRTIWFEVRGESAHAHGHRQLRVGHIDRQGATGNIARHVGNCVCDGRRSDREGRHIGKADGVHEDIIGNRKDRLDRDDRWQTRAVRRCAVVGRRRADPRIGLVAIANDSSQVDSATCAIARDRGRLVVHHRDDKGARRRHVAVLVFCGIGDAVFVVRAEWAFQKSKGASGSSASNSGRALENIDAVDHFLDLHIKAGDRAVVDRHRVRPCAIGRAIARAVGRGIDRQIGWARESHIADDRGGQVLDFHPSARAGAVERLIATNIGDAELSQKRDLRAWRRAAVGYVWNIGTSKGVRSLENLLGCGAARNPVFIDQRAATVVRAGGRARCIERRGWHCNHSGAIKC